MTATDCELRFATEADAARIAAIYNQAIAEGTSTGDTSPVTVASRREWLAGHESDAWRVIVACLDGHVCGWCSLSAYRPGRMALRHTAEISYYVDLAVRRQGVGSALIEHALKVACARHLRVVFAILLDINQVSVRLLERFGFDRWGHLPGVAEIGGRPCGHLYYGRRV